MYVCRGSNGIARFSQFAVVPVPLAASNRSAGSPYI